ncbi:putative aldehyde dehydrogenase [Myriangium duriaei CBS 260.36]|uniref:aldehyde dehydrogenase (NAD(+)) n=1 Tax=Myriangium duriaei CBS 260.36 TaxID=1168546 RepID=A0A9P4MCA6_9PEZI|nr:putative aldehyde dehydrogenase [Myriangium duriaei CBS 260.36]
MMAKDDQTTVKLTAPNGHSFVQPVGLFINNEWRVSSDHEKIETVNPSNGKAITSVYAASTTDVDLAVSAARAAFEDGPWREMTATDRGRLLYKLSDLIEQERELLATVETWDNGKPYTVALEEDLAEVVGTFRYYAGFADKTYGQVIDTTNQKFAYTVREPLGVCGQIIPWNYPLSMAAWKLGPALACGNTVVLKAAEQTPLSILHVANLVQKAGFPPGVVNILNGHGRVAGAALALHNDVDKIAFTGSTATGKQIMKMASGSLKNITLETGGKSPLIVFDDANLDQAVEWAHIGIMSNQGQICTATSRILVQRKVYNEFITEFRDRVQQISRVGDPFAADTFQGPQVTQAQFDRIMDYVKIGQQEGAQLFQGGKPWHKRENGYFIEPTIFVDVKESMKIYQEEVFGPFAVVLPFDTEDEGLRMANNSRYGLGSAIFTQNLTRAHNIARKIQAGMIWINSSNDSDWRVPFGGVKESGIGRELGQAGMEAYSSPKAVHVNLTAKL